MPGEDSQRYRPSITFTVTFGSNLLSSTWYYGWRRDGIKGLQPKTRVDSGQSKIAPAIQEAVLAAKRDNPRRSIRQIVRLLEAAGTVPSQSLSRSATHRLLLLHGLSQPTGSGHQPEERRSFTAEFAGGIWYGEVMHGPARARQRATAQDLPRLADR